MESRVEKKKVDTASDDILMDALEATAAMETRNYGGAHALLRCQQSRGKGLGPPQDCMTRIYELIEHETIGAFWLSIYQGANPRQYSDCGLQPYFSFGRTNVF